MDMQNKSATLQFPYLAALQFQEAAAAPYLVTSNMVRMMETYSSDASKGGEGEGIPKLKIIGAE